MTTEHIYQLLFVLVAGTAALPAIKHNPSLAVWSDKQLDKAVKLFRAICTGVRCAADEYKSKPEEKPVEKVQY